jgi:hypothetical protein
VLFLNATDSAFSRDDALGLPERVMEAVVSAPAVDQHSNVTFDGLQYADAES